MGMISSFSKTEDPELAELLKNLDAITVRVYELSGDTKAAYKAIDKSTKLIKKEQWPPIVSIKEEGENVKIFSKMSNEKMEGLVVMVVNPKEAVFINIVGEIDPAKFSKVTESLNIYIGDKKK